MGFLNTDSMHRLVEKLADGDNIKITGNSKGNRVGTVVKKIVEKADDVTKAIKQEVVNDSYSFKVGTGNVDVSADVEDGFGEVGVKGVTYQNILNNFSMDNKASKYITVNENTIKWTKSEVTTFNVNIKYHNSLAQLGKTYTLVFYIYKNTLQKEGAGDSYNVAKFNIISYDGGFCLIPVNKTGLVKVKLIQPTTTPTDSKPYLEVFKESVGELEISYPILLEGDYTNDDKIPSQFEGIVGVGDKSKNLFNYKLHDSIEYNGSYYTVVKERWRSNTVEYTVEPNTDYTISVDRCEGNLWLAFDVDGVQFNNNNYSKFSKVIRTNETGKLLLRVGANTSADVGHKFINLQLEKGTVAPTYEPYHDGHKIEILSCGKNLWDLKNKSVEGYIEHPTGNLHKPDCQNRTSDFIRIKPNTTYTYMTTVDVSSSNHPVSWNAVAWYDENKNYITRSVKTGNSMGVDTIIFTLQSPSNAKYVRVGSRYLESKFSKATFSEGVISEHIPYVEDKTQILLDEPLMRLPNGVHDEITRDGKLIRRVGKVVLDGSEDEQYSTENFGNGILLFKLNQSRDYSKNRLICNTFPVFSTSQYGRDFEACYWVQGLKFMVKESKLSTQNISGFKQWLSQNPTTVYYELETPTIIELPAPYLRIFKDGHITFNTLVAPESTHVVQLNKSAQIERSIREVQGLDSRVGQLESFYDDMILETSHKLNLLTYDFEYTKESEDI